MGKPPYLWADATISDCGLFRYDLVRTWAKDLPTVTFIMLNPSTADGRVDDPTIRRCVGFAKRWKCGTLRVANLFALRSTSPGALYESNDPIGPKNDEAILAAARAATNVTIAAWGVHGVHLDRGDEVRRLLRSWKIRLYHLGLSVTTGQPRHPLYLNGETAPERLV